MKEENGNGKIPGWGWFLISILVVFLILLGILLYYSSFGKIDLINSIEDKIITKNKWIDHRIRKLNKHRLSKIELKKKLDKYVLQLFLLFRIVVVLLVLIGDVVLYYYCGLTNFSDRIGFVLNINEAIIILYVISLFLYTSKISDLKDLIRKIHLKIQKVVYRKFITLHEDVLKIEIEINQLGAEQEKNKAELKRMQEEKLNLEQQIGILIKS